jgi:hypothetical protein
MDRLSLSSFEILPLHLLKGPEGNHVSKNNLSVGTDFEPGSPGYKEECQLLDRYAFMSIMLTLYTSGHVSCRL